MSRRYRVFYVAGQSSRSLDVELADDQGWEAAREAVMAKAGSTLFPGNASKKDEAEYCPVVEIADVYRDKPFDDKKSRAAAPEDWPTAEELPQNDVVDVTILGAQRTVVVRSASTLRRKDYNSRARARSEKAPRPQEP